MVALHDDVRARQPEALRVPVLMGPTAAGKTRLAVDLALRAGNIEIISADSRQVYVGMDIGTAKPTMEERAGVPHHLIDIVTPDTLFSAGQFRERASALIEEITTRGNTPFVAGGSGFYVRALFEGLRAPTVDQEILARLTERGEREGYDVLHAELAAVDPVAAAAHSPNNHIKTLRALCCWHQTGQPYSTYLTGTDAEAAPAGVARYVPVYLGIMPARDVLYARINARALAMMEEGFPDEVRRLVSEGYEAASPGLRTVGYTEMLEHLAGRLSYERAVELMQQGTRRFAKRQMTWYRNMAGVKWMEEGDVDVAVGWLSGILNAE